MMKNLKIITIKTLQGKDLKIIDARGTEITITSKMVFEHYIGVHPSQGGNNLKVWKLGLKIARLTPAVNAIELEDAELGLLKLICNSAAPFYSAIVHAQIELCFEAAETNGN